MQDTQIALDEGEEQGLVGDADGGISEKSLKDGKRKPVMDKVMSVHPSVNPSLKYVGFSLLMAYHYIMWFSPSSFFKTDLLAGSVTAAWLCNLVATALTLIVVACVLGRKKHLSDRPLLSRVIAVLLVVVTALLLYGAPLTRQSLVIDIFSFIAGALEGLMWVLWGESLTRARANFSVVHIGTTFGATVLIAMLISLFLPDFLVPLFVVLLAAFSGVFLYVHKQIPSSYPVLLPRDTVKPAFPSVMAVCSVGCFVGVACYYLVAIVPWERFAIGEYIFEIGVIAAAVLILVVSGLSVLFKAKASMFKLFPYYLVFAIVGLTLFQSHQSLFLLAFVVGLSVSSLLEISLIMYFGTLMRRGFFAPALAIAFSVASIRIGIALGNCLGLFYENNPAIAQVAVGPTTLIFICVLAFVLVPVGKLEPRFVALTTAPAAPSEIDTICDQIIQEFKLSEREGQILRLIARGNTVNNIANKLVISPHTVNTHIRHIYDKIGIHKRNELIEYINMKKEENA